jgi:hypothetical protein
MMIRSSRIIVACALAVAWQAGEAPATQDVGSPVVDEGEKAVEVRTGWQHDGDSKRMRVREHLDYGFTDAFALRVISQQQDTDNESFHYRATELEARWQWVEKGTGNWASGMRASYEYSDPANDSADEVKLRFLNAWNVDPMEFRFNLDFGHEVGPSREAGLKFGIQAQAMYAVYPNIDAGVELFSDYDSFKERDGWNAHQHQFGPVVKMGITDNLAAQAGYLIGLNSSSPDGEAKLFVSWTW